MNEMIEETVRNMMQPGERTEEDYIGEDGLLYCGKCNEPKEAYFDPGKDMVFGMKKHPRECECRRKKRKEEEQYREQQRHETAVRELKSRCFSERAMLLSRKLNDALSSRLFYAHFDSHRDISHFKSSCFCELFF